MGLFQRSARAWLGRFHLKVPAAVLDIARESDAMGCGQP